MCLRAFQLMGSGLDGDLALPCRTRVPSCSRPSRRGLEAAEQAERCGFLRLRTGIPIDCGQSFQSIADSIPMIADSSLIDSFKGSFGSVWVKPAALAGFFRWFAQGLAVEREAVRSVHEAVEDGRISRNSGSSRRKRTAHS
jgi:hypothetical protein